MSASGCATAKVKVADHPDSLGPHGHIRVDANGLRDTDTAVAVIPLLDKAAGLPCVVSSALETSVGLAAQLALAGALPELDFACGLGTRSLLQGDVVPDAASLRPVGGYLPVPRTPPAPDPALLATHELTGQHQAAWWRERLRRVYSA